MKGFKHESFDEILILARLGFDLSLNHREEPSNIRN